jgi:transcriptional regulator with XRE-family HTH domain
MPKLRKEIAELKAKRLTNLYIENGLNQARVANREGVSRQAINQRLKHLPVKTPLQEAFRKIGITTRYKAKKFKELLEAKKIQDCDVFIKDENGKLKVNRNSNDFIEVEDNPSRVATLRLLCQVEGDIKENGNGKGVNATILIRIGDKSGLLSPAETSVVSPERIKV